MKKALSVIGSILHFLFKLALLPVQAALTFLLLAIGYLGGLIMFITGLFGTVMIAFYTS